MSFKMMLNIASDEGILYEQADSVQPTNVKSEMNRRTVQTTSYYSQKNACL